MIVEITIVLAAAVIIAVLLIMFGRSLVFATTMLHGPVFVPSADDRLRTMLSLAKIKKGEQVIDVGAGDGKIVLALARKGIAAEGVEINPLLVSKAKKKIAAEKLASHARVYQGNFWKIDFSKYDVILFYGTSYVMEKLEKKLKSELKPGARVVSNYFQFPNWPAKKRVDEVSLYIRP